MISHRSNVIREARQASRDGRPVGSFNVTTGPHARANSPQRVESRPAIAAPLTVKALVVHSPYAQAIASGEKPIEYRCWSCRYRGWLAIVAARRRESGSDAGRIVCFVRLVDIEGCEGNYEWMLADPVPLKERIEIPGRLGLFDITERLPAWALAMLR